MKSALGLSIIAVILSWGLRGAAPQPADWVVLLRDDFEVPANAWETAWGDLVNGSWQRIKDGSNTVYSGQGSRWLNLNGQAWGDFRFRSRVKLLQGALHINYRLKYNAHRYYVSVRSDGIRFHRAAAPWPSGEARASASGVYPAGVWYDIEIVGIGGVIKTYVDGVLKMEYADPAPFAFGGVAFECLGDSRAYVDDIEISGQPPVSSLTWVKTGGPLGGIGYDVRMHPSHPDVMYVTDAFSGVHISRDGGRTWTASNRGITSRTGRSGDAIPIFCLSLDPNWPDTVWAGTIGVRGVFKSTDGGKSWAEKTSGIREPNITFRGITVDPNDSNTVYAAAEIGVGMGKYHDQTKGVVYRSQDGGENWTAIWRGDNLARYVWVDPRNSKLLYVSTGIFDREAANSDFFKEVSGGVGILKSADRGQTWQQLGAANGLGNLYAGSLFMHPRNSDILLAGTGFNPYQTGAGVYLSTDQGDHWRRGTLADSGRPIDEIISAVEIAEADPRIAYAANPYKFFRSEDGGRTWRLRSGGPPTLTYGPPRVWMGWPVDIQVDPRNPDRVFLNNYAGGVFVSENGGSTWQESSRGYTGASAYQLALDPFDAATVYAIAFSGPFRSVDGGAHWTGLLSGPAARPTVWSSVALDPANPSTVLMADAFNATILRSTNGGQDWTEVFRHEGASMDSPFSPQGFKAIAFAPSNPRTVYAGLLWERTAPQPGPYRRSFGLFKSLDGGRTWLESNDAVSTTQSFNKLVVDPGNENLVYAATRASGVIKSSDGGRTWRPANQGLKGSDVRTLALDPNSRSTIYAGLEDGGLFKSTDAGATWQMSAAGLDPQSSIRDIVIDPVNPQTVYAADVSTGVYRSTNGGRQWQAVTRGLTTRSVSSLAITPDGGTLYAASDGEGVFRLDVAGRNGATLSAGSAASFDAGVSLARDSIASAFGAGLAARTELPSGTSPSAEIGGVSLSVVDAAGTELPAPLFFVSPGQVNFLVPHGINEGPAVLRVKREGRYVARGTVQIETVAPGLFTANANGQGVPAAQAARYGAGGEPVPVPVFQCAGTCSPAAMDLGGENEQLILMLYGTGLRNARAVTATIGGVEAPVLGFAAQSQYPGLDQVNVRVPRELKGRGEVDVLIKAEGKAANAVKVRVR